MEALIIGCLIVWDIALTVLVGALFIEMHCINKTAENDLKNQHHFTICNPDLDQMNPEHCQEQRDEIRTCESTSFCDESYRTLL